MLKRLIIISFLLISTLFVYSCEDCCEMTDYGNYFPLIIGNKWYYGNSRDEWTVIGTKIINSKQYFEILEDINTYSLLRFYRFDGPKLWELTNEDSLEHLLADFSLKEGQGFHQNNTGFKVTVWSDDPNEFAFYYDNPEWFDEEYAITFRLDVGIISNCSIAWGGCTNLTDYELQ